MSEFEKALEKKAEDLRGFCYCAGPTCSGCEDKSIELFSTGADWAREWFTSKKHDLELSYCFVMNEKYDKLRTENQRLIEDQQIKFDLIMQHGQTIQRLRDALERVYGDETDPPCEEDCCYGRRVAKQALAKEKE